MVTVLEIPRSHSHLLTNSNTSRLQFDIKERVFVESQHYHPVVSQEVYDWLIDTVGYEQSMFRKLDGIIYDRTKVQKLLRTKIKTPEEWNKINPVLPKNKQRTWWKAGNHRDEICFVSPDLAALFKLRWF